ncbi:ATP-binding protein [Cesiribacter andamanensis]|uniref:Serine-protein kinase RsbW n=1 Tax=Cesiribacter andamanensis AMV16 TaxID=1279009 RepID=M7N608_9BACT|nr:ATP-binding protein [Cesiribacter andamanensis]EMR02671.1 serine-protein kinase RsbW [Cesiribacter andamanensis AMV16]
MKYSIKVPCCKSKLKTIRSFVDDTLGQYIISDIDLNMLVLAVDEVCANLIVHADKENHLSEECIVLNILVRKNTIVFEVIDFKDHGFDFSNYQEPKLDDLIKSRRKGGLGLMLVRRIMDDVEFKTTNSLNVCRMVKKMPVVNA